MTDAAVWDFGEPVVGYRWSPPRPRARVLLQHGYGEHAERFVTRYSRLIPTLVGAGFEVHAFDLPGHGRSAGRRGTVDVLAAAEIHRSAKSALLGDTPLLLFGHSLGGLITAHTMTVDPPGVSGVVLTSAALPLNTRRPLRVLSGVLSGIAPHARAPLPSAPASALARPPENAALIAADPLMYRGKLTNLTAHSALRTAAAVWRGTPPWTAPTLIMHGTADRSTDPRGSERLSRRLSGGDRELVLVPGGRHELLNDVDGLQVRDRIVLWLGDRV